MCSALPPDPSVLTTFDRDCRFRNAAEAVIRRRDEDRAALRRLAARPVHLGFVDSQYGEALDVFAVADALVSTIDELDPEMILAPVGLAHPDHLATAIACRLAREKARDRVWWVYEELPARVLWPEMVPDALKSWGRGRKLDFVGTGPVADKEQAIRAYRSQLWALDWHTLLVPERHWRLS